MALGVSAPSPAITGFGPGSGGTGQSSPAVPFGLRGAISLGSGLRTGVTVVERAIQTSAELSEARERAREALAEEARLEREAASAEEAARREELNAESTDAAQAGAETAPIEGASTQTIDAAVAAGEAGEETPRGAFVDFTI